MILIEIVIHSTGIIMSITMTMRFCGLSGRDKGLTALIF